MNNTEKKLWRHGCGPAIAQGVIIVKDTRHVVVDLTDGSGNTRTEETDKLAQHVIKSLSTDKHPWGGFRAAGGHWYLEKNYDPKPLAATLADHTGDWSEYSKL